MKSKIRYLNILWIPLLLISVTFYAGCGSSTTTTTTTTVTKDRITVSTLAGVTQLSDADYNNNTYGLITVATLKSWLDDWSANKPSAITGNLIILAVSTGGTSREYINDAAAGISSYSISSSDYAQERSSGPIATRSMVSNGAGADATLKKFAINPAADMVVVVMGDTSSTAWAGTGGNMSMGRIWYMLRYWGVAKENVSILSGGLDYWTTANGGLADSYFKATVTTPPDNGTATVKDLLVDNTILQISLGELITWVDGTVVPSAGYVVWDVRSSAEYDGSDVKSGAGGGIFEGHIKGAVNFVYTALLDSTKGYAYRDKATLATLIAVAAPTADTVDPLDGSTGLGYSATDATAGKIIISHCRTAWRSMIATIATTVVLGYPHRTYDGAWAEWGDLSNDADSAGNTGLAADSPWITDTTNATVTVARSASVTYPPSPGGGVVPTVVDSDAASATAIIDEDKGYKY